MALVKTSTLIFDAITVSGNSYSDESASVVDLTDAVDFAVGYRLTFDAASTSAGVSIYMYSDPSASDAEYDAGTYDIPADKCDIDGSGTNRGHTVASTYRMDHSGKYVKFKVRNHDAVSITNMSVWAIVQKP